jgi:hypothetical protein
VSRNRQHGHVGNLGDVTKHAALVELAAMLAERFASVSFVDTHTFLLHAPLANAELWRREADSRLAKQPAYARYVELERAYLQRTGEYRCSSGLVLDVLGEQLACAVLGEANGLTRAELKGQLAKEQHTRVHVVDEARAVDREARVPSAGALLVHVDPFTLTPEAWAPPRAGARFAVSARGCGRVRAVQLHPRRPHRVALASNRHELRRRAPRRPPRGRAVRVGGCGGGRARHRCLARLA